MGGDLSYETLRDAYSHGIFPWPQEGYPLLWFSPPQRGVLFFENFKIPKTTLKAIKNQNFEIRFNTDFDQVIENCARIPRSSETGTWILPELIDAYCELSKRGETLCVEAWQGEKMVGGLYGVLLSGVFSGESMFFKETEASKVCLVECVEHLKKIGHEWMDIQMVTPVLEQFGGEYISRKDFLALLSESSKRSS